MHCCTVVQFAMPPQQLAYAFRSLSGGVAHDTVLACCAHVIVDSELHVNLVVAILIVFSRA